MHPNPVIQHIYDQLDQRKNRQQQINKLTSQLIKEQRIQPGDNLYLFLGLIKRCDNTQAIQTWISEILDDIDVNDDQEKYQQLEHKFLKLTPLSTLYNSLILKGLKFNNFLAKNCKPSIYRALEKRVESQVKFMNISSTTMKN